MMPVTLEVGLHSKVLLTVKLDFINSDSKVKIGITYSRGLAVHFALVFAPVEISRVITHAAR